MQTHSNDGYYPLTRKDTEEQEEVLQWRQKTLCYLTLLGGLGWQGGADPILNRDGMNEHVALRDWEERLFLLAKVQLHGAVFAQDVRQQSSVAKGLLADPEGHAEVLSVLGEGQLHLFAVKVLQCGGQAGRSAAEPWPSRQRLPSQHGSESRRFSSLQKAKRRLASRLFATLVSHTAKVTGAF